jgi:plasmid stability protein
VRDVSARVDAPLVDYVVDLLKLPDQRGFWVCGALVRLASCDGCSQNDGMSSIYVRDLSESALTTLKVRAARAGQSLQVYVKQLLEGEAAELTLSEAAEQARELAARSAVNADDVVATINAMREARA